ncbi:enolase C-terminal domain-like protein [Teichococcus oryzae]|uniref:enolase C-terminal domain-like protein n=1 Tax=Teichococcus oryzae TaxID=1608942 RepID=UPI001F4F73D2|nr:enolase C-terminal domain-like protein [Pseudoroseomonas oryzae]
MAHLLGGRVRDAAPLSFSLADPDFAADLERMKAMVAAGNRLFKAKTGVQPHADDMAHPEAIRDGFGNGIGLGLDYMEPFRARTVLRDVDRFRPTFIEQPAADRGDAQHLARLRVPPAAPCADRECAGRTDRPSRRRHGGAGCARHLFAVGQRKRPGRFPSPAGIRSRRDQTE